jgi:hypothetical protein
LLLKEEIPKINMEFKIISSIIKMKNLLLIKEELKQEEIIYRMF